jgi:hypothetical protein
VEFSKSRNSLGISFGIAGLWILKEAIAFDTFIVSALLYLFSKKQRHESGIIDPHTTPGGIEVPPQPQPIL